MDAGSRRGACTTVLDDVNAVCSPTVTFTDTDGTVKTVRSCTKAYVNILNYGPATLQPKGDWSDTEWDAYPRRRSGYFKHGRDDDTILQGVFKADFSTANQFAARLAKRVVCISTDSNTECSVSKEGFCVKCPYMATHDTPDIRPAQGSGQLRNYQGHCASAQARCANATGEWTRFENAMSVF